MSVNKLYNSTCWELATAKRKLIWGWTHQCTAHWGPQTDRFCILETKFKRYYPEGNPISWSNDKIISNSVIIRCAVEMKAKLLIPLFWWRLSCPLWKLKYPQHSGVKSVRVKFSGFYKQTCFYFKRIGPFSDNLDNLTRIWYILCGLKLAWDTREQQQEKPV